MVVDAVVVFVPQEAKTIEAIMRKLTNIQIIPLFTYFSFLFEDFWEMIKTLFLIILILLPSLNIFIYDLALIFFGKKQPDENSVLC